MLPVLIDVLLSCPGAGEPLKYKQSPREFCSGGHRPRDGSLLPSSKSSCGNGDSEGTAGTVEPFISLSLSKRCHTGPVIKFTSFGGGEMDLLLWEAEILEGETTSYIIFFWKWSLVSV